MAKASKGEGGLSGKQSDNRTFANTDGFEVPAPTPSVPKQAVVVFHGMGEQRPMGTLRSFVQTVWSEDTELVDPTDEENEFWIKPDALTGAHELRRITTRPIRSSNTGDGQERRTDFFECYWADIMEGNQFRDVLAWVKPLLFRRLDRVPDRVKGLWGVLWALLLLLTAIVVLKLVELTLFLVRLGGAPSVESGSSLTALFEPFIKLAAPVLHGLSVFERGLFYVSLAIAVLFFSLAVWKALDGARKSMRSTALVLLTAITFVAFALPTLVFLEEVLGGFVLLLPALYLLQKQTILPLFGDVARYVQAGTNTVAERQAVRDRALQLLRDLHLSQRYDRIIVVAHSLGSIIAYDVLSILWSELGPNHRNGMSPEVRNHFQDMDAFLNGRLKNPRPQETPLHEFRKLQRELVRKMASEWEPHVSGSDAEDPNDARINTTPRWLITDFVTMGSPLTHAEFLMAESTEKVEQSIRERIFHTAPPVMERDNAGNATMLYEYASGETFPHHASMFAATRWTNIYDAGATWREGDVFSGPVSGLFGNALRIYRSRETTPETSELVLMKDINVDLYRNTEVPFIGSLIQRWFTHTRYWNPKAGRAYPMKENSGAGGASNGTPDHIALLRQAVNLRDTPDLDPQADPGRHG